MRLSNLYMVLLSFMPWVSLAQDDKRVVDCQLSVSVTNIQVKDGGQVCIKLFKSEEGFPLEGDKAIISKCQSTSNVESRFKLTVPHGVYAISVLHDANRNNEMDSNFFGIPKEGVGSSNDAKGSFGPPSFKDASFKVDKGCQSQKIKMAYL